MTFKNDVSSSGKQLQVAQQIGFILILSIDFRSQKIRKFTEIKLGNMLIRAMHVNVAVPHFSQEFLWMPRFLQNLFSRKAIC